MGKVGKLKLGILMKEVMDKLKMAILMEEVKAKMRRGQ